MIRVRLAGQRLALATEQTGATALPDGRPLLLHQMRTVEALRAGHEVVINTYDTGAGKTVAALERLRDLHQRPPEESQALLIAPTNELIGQHVRATDGFVARHTLDYRVQQLTAPELRTLAEADSTPEHLRRPVRVLRALLEAPERTVVVTNPDIFYYALFFRYNRMDQRALFRQFFSRFWYVIIDEFHYYSPKQLICFLFYLALSKHWGYFGAGRQVALLSATPTSQVREYLRRLDLNVKVIDPQDGEAASRPAIPSLAPLDLELASAEERQGLVSLVEEQQSVVIQQVQQGEQGAGISSALWRVNQAYARLRHSTIGSRVGRITGPEDPAARAKASQHDVILATPTVDIGYNFERSDKPRQSLDFLLCDARSADELVQRLGRAGRVLGKQESSISSRAWATVPQPLIDTLRPHDGQEIDRLRFRQLVHEAMSPRFSDEAYRYIASGGISEIAHPLSQLAQMMSREEERRLAEIFDSIRTVFAPDSQRTYESVMKESYWLRHQIELFDGFPRDVRDKTLTRPQQAKVREAADRFRRETGSNDGAQFCRWVEEQQATLATAQARFQFRDSFSPPAALLYDPQRLLSSAEFVRYDVTHVLQHYAVTWFTSEREWRQAVPARAPACGDELAYGVLRDLLPPEQRLRLRFHLRTTAYVQSEWEEKYCWREAAIRGIEMEVEEGALPAAVSQVFRERFLPLYAARSNTIAASALLGLCCNEGWIVRDLTVTFADGAACSYLVIFGTLIFSAAIRLRRQGYLQRRLDAAHESGIII
ncbi:MAG: type I-D CRISPR-associated helicase Cas3' [Chloroflexi bacterium]|nr:type I-D CRISPR-associated helicase Cas3' [Chloroflexota bacterium]